MPIVYIEPIVNKSDLWLVVVQATSDARSCRSYHLSWAEVVAELKASDDDLKVRLKIPEWFWLT